MPQLAAAAAVVVGWIVTTAAIITATVASVVTMVASAISGAAAIVSGLVAGLTATVAATISYVYGAITTALIPTMASIKTVAQVIYIGVWDFVTAVQLGWAAFAEAIHLKTLLMVHNIAYMVSSQYRAVLAKVWGQIAIVSGALGYSADFLLHAFRNARGIVLTASGMLGRKYDIAEIAWVSQWNEYLKRMEAKATLYFRNPELVLIDLDNFLIEQNVDAMGGAMQTVYTTIDDMLLGIEGAVKQSVELRDQVEKFVAELPESIQERVRPMIDPIIEKFDTFYTDTYQPNFEQVDRILEEVGATLGVHKDDIGDIVERLKRPGDILIDIENLPLEDRFDQEEKVTRTAAKRYDRDRQAMQHHYIPKEIAFLKLAEALKKEIPPPGYHVPEVEKPGRPADTPVEPRKTWNVGDY